MATTIVDDFEDGDITITATDWSGWGGDTGSFAATSTNPIAGSFSGELTTTGSFQEVQATRTAEQKLDAEVSIEIDTQTGNGSDFVEIDYIDAGSTNANVRFVGDGSITSNVWSISSTWTAATVYDIRIEPDFDNDEAELYINNSLEDTASFSPTGLETFTFGNGAIGSGSTVNALIDDVTVADTPLLTPDLSIDATRADEVDLSIAVFPEDAEEVEIYRSESSPVTTGDTLITTLTPPTLTHTDTGLENGEQYFYTAIAKDTDGPRPDSELAPEVTTTTTLPAPTIDSSVADSQTQITLNWTLNDNSTDGDVDIVRDSVVIDTVAIATTTYQDTSLTEATSYDYIIRRNTDDASTDSPTDTQFTKPNAPTNLVATANESKSAVDLTWDDNSSGEDGYEILEEIDSGGQTQISSEPANTTTFTTPKRDRLSSFEYQVRAFAGTGDSRADSVSNLDTASFDTYDNYWATVTPPGGNTEDFASPHVSYVDLEHTAIHGAGVVLGNIDADIANWGPKTDIQLFLDTERIFAGEIIRLREDTPSEGQTDVTAKGPVKELENAGPTSEVTYSGTLAYLAIDDYFTNEITGIDVNATVYTPPETLVEDDTLLLSADSAGYSNLVLTDLTNVPITASGSYLLEQSAFIGVEDDFDGAYTTQADSPGVPPYHVSGEWAELSPGDTVDYDFIPQHNIPADRVGVAVRVEPSGSGNTSSLVWTLNGDDLGGGNLLSPNANQWVNLPNEYAGGDLSSGVSYEMAIESGDFSLDIDAMVVYDTEYVGGSFSDITSFGETLDNPVPYNPVEIDIETEARPNAIKSGRVDSTVSNIGGDFRHRVTVTDGASELTSTNADDTFDFFGNSQYGTTFDPFLRLDGEGANSVFSSGVNAQEVTKLDYYLTTVDTEVIESLSLTGSHYDNLRQLHRIAGFNFVTDPRFDPDIDGINIESFLPGSPDSQKSVDWTTIDIDVEREFDGYANAVTVAYEDENGDTQVFNGAPDSAEVSEVGATVRKQIFDTSISTIDEARIRSEREKRKRIARDTTTGEIEAVASFTLPGYSYNISDFGGYTTLDGRVSYRESPDDVTMSLQFKPDRDNVQRLLDTQEELEQVKES